MLKTFHLTIFLSIIGLMAAAYLGYQEAHSSSGALQFLFTASILALLEIVISFDNAIVNASVLKNMTLIWQKRFLTWGILIAVFGMRLVFPIVIVCFAAALDPISAISMAMYDPKNYASIMLSVHPQVASFGGAFLALVALSYFFDSEKETHWIGFIEKRLSKMGALKSTEIGITLLGLWLFSKTLSSDIGTSVLFSGVAGVLTFIAVKLLGELLSTPEQGTVDLNKQSVALFLYLEVLDASFSFDGVVAAFAITANPLLIAIGLGIGALFVRSFTILMVEKGSLKTYIFLESGAFWAIGILAIIMFTSINVHLPETISGGLGLVVIAASFIHSQIYQKRTSHKSHSI